MPVFFGGMFIFKSDLYQNAVREKLYVNNDLDKTVNEFMDPEHQWRIQKTLPNPKVDPDGCIKVPNVLDSIYLTALKEAGLDYTYRPHSKEVDDWYRGKVEFLA